MPDTRTRKKREELEKAEVISLINMFVELMNAYGNFSGNLGKIQKTHEEVYKHIFSLEAIEKLPEMLGKLMEEKPPELGKLVIKIFAKMTVILPRVSKIMDLSADDKIKLGENLKSLAKDFRKLLEWVEKQKE